MFNVGGGEIIVILLLALLVLGPDKLPSTAKKVGRFLHELRRMTSGFEQEVRSAMDLDSLGLGSSGVSTSDDAIHRTTAGPDLAGPDPASRDAAATSSSADSTPTSTPTAKRAFVADLSEPRTPRPDDPST